MSQSPAEPEQQSDVWSALGSTRVIADQSSDDTESAPSPSADASDPVSSTSLPKQGQNTVAALGDFRLVKKVGQGAMATVYKARQISFDRKVALKVLFKHVADHPKLVERFYREARVMGQLDHPNIVQGYCVGEDKGLHFFAMEYVNGESLQKWLNRLGTLNLGDALHVTLACARALEYAHNLELVHRDVKPDNVLITRTGLVKLTDLGMVKQLDEDMGLTQTGYAVGTPWYMPLEQAKNSKDTDRRSDIYALGCLLYCLLTGRPPFAGATLVDVIQAKEVGTFPPARQFNQDVPERLDLILAKMTAKLPRYRYDTCAEILLDLEALGLESPALSFVSLTAQAKHKAAKTAESEEMAKTRTVSPSARTPLPAAPAADVWFIRFKSQGGQTTCRKLTTAQILKLIEDRQLDPKTKVSRDEKDGFRALATYKEFEQAVLSDVSKTGADRAASRYRALYKKIEEADRERDTAEEREVTSYSYWGGIALKIGVVVVPLVGLLWLALAWLNSFK